jgi:hypothetical protein
VNVLKNNDKLHICVDYHKMNVQMKKIHFLHLFELNVGYVVGHEMYYFMDGYSGYNQVKLVEEDKEKKTFILKWDAYAYNVIPFGLCKAFTTFLKVVTKTFMNS